MYVCTQTHTDTRTHTDTHTQAKAKAHEQKQKHTHTHTHAHTHTHTTDVMEGAAHFWAEPSQTGLHFWGGGEAVLEQEPVWEEEAGIEIMVMEEVVVEEEAEAGEEEEDNYYLSGRSGRMIRGQANV